MKSVTASSRRIVDGNILEPDQRDFLGNVGGLQMTASSRIHSRTDLNRIDETHGKVTVEEGDLVVSEKNIDRQSHTHHNWPLWEKLKPKSFRWRVSSKENKLREPKISASKLYSLKSNGQTYLQMKQVIRWVSRTCKTKLLSDSLPKKFLTTRIFGKAFQKSRKL